MKRLLIVILIMNLVTACSTLDRVLPDTRNEYKKSEVLPDLEVPPDLTADTINDDMALPTERGSLRALRERTAPEAIQKRADIQDVGSNRRLLTIPEEFTVVWNDMENLLLGAGLEIEGRNQARGIYQVVYDKDSGEEKSWMSRMAFWRGGKEDYQLSLTGVGDKTEIAVLDEDGEWETNVDADLILSRIRTQYNARANRAR